MKHDILRGVDLLPHREPFLFLDRLISFSSQGSVGEVTFGAERDFFCGHFPGLPIVPGVILLEAMCQSAAAGALAERKRTPGESGTGLLLFAGADRVRFRRPVRPGETLVTKAEVLCLGHGVGKFHVQGYVGKEKAVEAELTCVERPLC